MSARCHQRISRLDAVLLVELVRFGGVNGQALLKRLCKTNCAAPRGTSHNKPTSWQWKSRTRDAHTSMRILELENRCTGNRTVASNPIPPSPPQPSLHSKAFGVECHFQPTKQPTGKGSIRVNLRRH